MRAVDVRTGLIAPRLGPRDGKTAVRIPVPPSGDTAGERGDAHREIVARGT
jgi:hypothetical protein